MNTLFENSQLSVFIRQIAKFYAVRRENYAFFRKAEGNWYIFKSSTGNYAVQKFGVNGDMPIPAAFIK